MGVNSDGTAKNFGIGFDWYSTYDGTAGGIATTKGILPPDPGSGTGGVTITHVQSVVSVAGAQPTPERLLSGSKCNGFYTGSFKGNITVSAGQRCVFSDGSIVGNIAASGGTVVLSNVLISGNVQFSDSAQFSINSYTTIRGNLIAQNLMNGVIQNSVCDSTVYGNSIIQASSDDVQIGSAAPSCGGNTVLGNLIVQNNTGSISLFGNTVSGNLLDQNNRGPNELFSNTVINNLSCSSNSLFQGANNIAKKKLGDCPML